MIDKPILISLVITVAIQIAGYVYYQWKYRRRILSGDLCRWRYFLFALFISSYAGLYMFRSISNTMQDNISPDRASDLGIFFIHLALILPFAWYAKRNMGQIKHP